MHVMQTPSDVPTILLEHDVWCTDQLLTKAAGLTHDQLHQRFDLGIGSVHDTFLHIIAAMVRWSQRIDARPLTPWTGPEENTTKYTIDQLRAMLHDAAQQLRSTMAIAQRQGWNSPVELGSAYSSSSGNKSTTKAAAFTHVCTHGTHHRSQVFSMLRQLGITLDSGDFDPVEWDLKLQSGS